MTQQPVSGLLAQDITLHCLVGHGSEVELAASLSYEVADPFAVRLTFHVSGAPDADDVDWVMARSILIDGLTDPAGDGDVRVWPGIDEAARAVMVLDFHSPDGRLVAEVHSRDVHRFLTRTLAAVPAGTESDHVDLDGLIAVLLGTSDPD